MPKVLNRESVLWAIEQCDEMGREAFLAHFGFHKALDYLLSHDGRIYDSKAIFAVAYGHENPKHGPLKSVEFSGGLGIVVPNLKALGFDVQKGTPYDAGPMTMGPIVLVENEATEGGKFDDWRDVTGERYEFPNGYSGFIVPGCRFVYYRGVRRLGGKRGAPEYFGCGTIAEVVRDPDLPASTPKHALRWFARVEDYVPFASPVPFKQGNVPLENIAPNRWGTCRRLSLETYRQILRFAHVERLVDTAPGELIKDAPPLGKTSPRVVKIPGSLLLGKTLFAGGTGPSGGSGGRSGYSKAIGDRAEEIVLAHLKATLSSGEKASLRWPAREGTTPGWDIQYAGLDGTLRAIEVKGTRGPRFPSFEMSANEWNAAGSERERYSVYLVASCLSSDPMIDPLRDPVGMQANGLISVITSTWRIAR